MLSITLVLLTLPGFLIGMEIKFFALKDDSFREMVPVESAFRFRARNAHQSRTLSVLQLSAEGQHNCTKKISTNKALHFPQK